MKNILKVLAPAAILILIGCGSSSKPDVLGKSFTFKECTKEEMKSGTSDFFYSDSNYLGTTKQEMLDKITTTLYDTGSSIGGDGSCIYFSDHLGLTGYKYNGQEVTCYSLNFVQINDYSISDNGYYALVNNQITLLTYSLDLNSLVANDFELCNHTTYISSKGTTISKVVMSVKSINYDSSSKTLTTVQDLTLDYTSNSITSEAICEYTISWSEIE